MKKGTKKFDARLPAQLPASSVAKKIPVASKDRCDKCAVPGQEYGKDQGEGRENATDGKARKSFTFQAMVPRWTITVIRGSRGKANETGTVW